MDYLDVSTLLEPVSPESPVGPDLEYSSTFIEAARALEGSPDVQYGSMHLPATQPDWKRVKAATLELLSESRDLRSAVWLTRALVSLHGAAAIADGLALIEGLIARYWDELHPRLDADDEHDATARISALLALDDKTAFLRELKAAPLVGSNRHGPVCLLDIERAMGEPSADETALDQVAIDAAFADAPKEQLTAVDEALARALSSLARIDALLNERIGHGRSMSLKALEQTLVRAGRAVRGQREKHSALAAHEGASAASTMSDATALMDGDAIAGRDDVVRALDRLCAFYARAEPSSPVPILLQRARRLVGMGFADLVAELTPAGVDQAAHWSGSPQP